MKRIVTLAFFLHVSLCAQVLILDDFRANVFSKADKKPVEIKLGLIFEGDSVQVHDYKVIDALNVIVSSYYAEDLVTSRGKELLKSTLIAYTKKAHSLTIDTIYIKELSVKMNPAVKEIVEAIKKEGIFQQNSTPKQPTQQQQRPQENYLAPPLPRKLPLPDENAINF
jgi:propanediol dehydratase large subunit